MDFSYSTSLYHFPYIFLYVFLEIVLNLGSVREIQSQVTVRGFLKNVVINHLLSLLELKIALFTRIH